MVPRYLLVALIAIAFGCGSESDSSTACSTYNQVIDGVKQVVQQCCVNKCTYHTDGTTDCVFGCACTIVGTTVTVACEHH
jgi:hypothetical protein